MIPRKFQPALRRLLVAALLLGASSTALAFDKNYSVTTPDGVVLAVQESGNPDGPAVVFIHGLLGSRLNWDAQTHSQDLQRFHMITYDLRGHALSSKPTNADAYSNGRHWADDLNAVIKAAHVQRPVVVGWSLGGTIISNYLAAYGDADIAGAVYVDGVVELKPEQIVPHPDVYRDLVSDDLKTHLDAVRTFLGLCFYAKPDTAMFERLLSNASMASWDMQRSVQSMTVAAADGLPKAHVPVLLIYGRHDALVNPVPTIARAKALNPGAQSELYEGSGHAPFLEESARFNHDIAAFVDASALRSAQPTPR